MQELKKKVLEMERGKFDESTGEVIVPTLKEKNERGISDKDWIMMCCKKHKERKCFKEYSGQPLCSLCPKEAKRVKREIKQLRGKYSWLRRKRAEVLVTDPGERLRWMTQNVW